jgi:hypothetical protein
VLTDPDTRSDGQIAEAIASFQARLPYRDKPFSGRAWGHPLHSLCSYQGKLKPAMAHWLIREFTEPGDLVIDPLSGVGTIPFEAALAGRRSFANDLSPFAATVARGKLDPPSLDDADKALRQLELAMSEVRLSAADLEAAGFGLNATVRDYYHPDTLDEVLRARRVFLDGHLNDQSATFVWASLLHVLHGNRPYALSRTSHPITPFSPKGPAEYKSVVGKTRTRVERALGPLLPPEFVAGGAAEGDFRDLPGLIDQSSATAIITSPPFLGMRFDRPNWLRLWFCGWDADDFHQTSLRFVERQQTKSLDCYVDLYAVCRQLLQDDGLLILHVGSGSKDRLVDGLRDLAQPGFRLVGETVEDVAELEQHGLSDKGKRTTSHHLLFLRRN